MHYSIRISLILTILLFQFSTISSAESYDFRKAKWGMSPTRVKASENKQPGSIDGNCSQSCKLIYTGEVGGLDTIYAYYFIDNKLVRGIYFFQESHLNSNLYVKDFQNIKEILTRKHGKPSLEKDIWNNDLFKEYLNDYGTAISLGYLSCYSQWIKPNTTILLTITGDNLKVTHGVSYTGNKYINLIESRQEKLEEQGL